MDEAMQQSERGGVASSTPGQRQAYTKLWEQKGVRGMRVCESGGREGMGVINVKAGQQATEG